MTKTRDSLTGLLQPLSMEHKTVYLERFVANRDMRALFGDPAQCREMAEGVFRTRWFEAVATVRRADGVEFFID